MNIIGNRKIFLTISGFLVAGSIAAVLVFGFRPGIDFKGGTLWQLKIEQTNIDTVKNFFANDLNLKDAAVYPAENSSFMIRLAHISEEQHQSFLSTIKNKFGSADELSFQDIGPAVGQELENRALWAIGLVILGISLYVAFAFRKVSYPVKSWKYGVGTLISLFHDVAIPAGLMAILGKLSGVEIDTNFVVSLLVVMGFSVHDTIVVFDRIRENLLLQHGRFDLATVINTSVNQTFARSVNTSLTLILVLLALLFFGPLTLHYFILTLLVGVFFGTYSSIFIASPLLLYLGYSK